MRFLIDYASFNGPCLRHIVLTGFGKCLQKRFFERKSIHLLLEKSIFERGLVYGL